MGWEGSIDSLMGVNLNFLAQCYCINLTGWTESNRDNTKRCGPQREHPSISSGCMLSRIRLFVTSWTVAHWAPLSMGLPRHEDWEWVSVSFSRESSQPQDRTCVSWLWQVASLPLSHLGSPISAEVQPVNRQCLQTVFLILSLKLSHVGIKNKHICK